IGEHLLKDFVRKKLARTADGGVPRQFVLQIVTYKKQNVQAHAAVLDELSVGDDVLQIPHQAQFEEHNGINTFLAGGTVERFGLFVQIVQIQYAFELSVEVLLGNTFTQ